MTEPEAQPVPPPSPSFQFTLWTLLLLFVVLGSSLAVFGAWGIVVFGVVVASACCLHQLKSLWARIGLVGILLGLLRLQGLLTECGVFIFSNWPNIATLAVWLLSVGTLLTHAVRSRKTVSAPQSPLAG